MNCTRGRMRTQGSRLCYYIVELLKMGLEQELCVRVAIFVVRLHHAQLAASGESQPILRELRDQTRQSVRAVRDQAGVNLAGMKLLKRSIGDTRATIAAPTNQLASSYGVDVQVKANDDADGGSTTSYVSTSTATKKKKMKMKMKKKKKP